MIRTNHEHNQLINRIPIAMYTLSFKPCFRDTDIEITTYIILEKPDNLQVVYQNHKHLTPYVGIYSMM